VGLVKAMKTLAQRLAPVLLAAVVSPSHAETVVFDWFEYRGNDKAFEADLPKGSYRNPILAGWHPDPSIVAANGKFYLVNSTFTFYPGIPVFESTDLVHWTQIGSVIDRPSQLDFDGIGVSRGVFAPTIEFHAGTFYVVNTAVDNGGNFYVTASDPAGPWSDPVWLPGIDGIDPSLFFDPGGKVYLLNNGPPEGEPLYDGHRAIWLQEFDLVQRKPVGPRKVLINGGVDLSSKPIWIEGPHIYLRDGWYYLVCAEGGTGPQHSQVVLRSRDIWGPYAPFGGNPILTQRDLDPARALPITNAGHADLVQGPDGSWWTTFLASRNYGGPHYNTGRETFLLPVEWEDGWPRILDRGVKIPYVNAGPSFLEGEATQAPMTGNFTWSDEFDRRRLDRAWMFVRVPKSDWARLDLHPGALTIEALAEGLDTLKNPSFLARRQQHLRFESSTALQVPETAGTDAGLAAFQNGTRWFFLGVRRAGIEAELFLERRAGGETETIVHTRLDVEGMLRLKISGDEGAYSFAYDADGTGWQTLRNDEDGTILSTDVAGGFVGAVIGPYARRHTAR
jgi:alpha-N-arabinofuranosidase